MIEQLKWFLLWDRPWYIRLVTYSLWALCAWIGWRLGGVK